MPQRIHVVEAPDGAVDLLASFSQDWESDPDSAARLQGLFVSVLRYVTSDEFDERHGDAEARIVIGTSYDLSDDAAAEISRFTSATGITVEVRPLAFRPPSLERSAVALHEDGVSSYRAGDFAAALEKIVAAITLTEGTAGVRLLGGMLNSLGMVHHAAGDPEAAESPLLRALALRRECSDERGEGITENNLGLVAMDLHRFDEARTHFQASLRLRELVGDTAGAMKTQTNLAHLERLAGEKAARHAALDGAVTAAEVASDAADLETECAVAAALESAGRRHEAVFRYRAAAVAAAVERNHWAELTARQALAKILGSLGSFEEARTELDRAEDLAIEMEAAREHAAILVTRAGVLHHMGRPNAALHDAQLAVAIARDVEDPGLTGSALNTAGVQYEEMGHTDSAIRAYEEALRLAEETHNVRGAVIAGANAALELQRSGATERALTHAHAAIEAARRAGDIDGASYGSYALARVCVDAGDVAGARTAFEDAIAGAESARTAIGGGELQASYLGSVQYVYADYVNALVAEGDTERAFEIADAAKSRWFADQLASGTLPPPAGLAPNDARLGDEARLLAELEESDRAVATGDAGAATHAHRGALLRELDEVWDALAPEVPEYVALRRGTPTSLADVRAALGDKCGLVDYFVGGDEIVAFVVAPGDGPPAVARTDITITALGSRLESFRREVADYPRGAAVVEHWHTALGRALVDPVLPHLEGLDLVYFSPHRLLHALPLHAVPVAGRPLGEQIAVAYTPSGSVHRLVVERDRARSMHHPDQTLVLAYTAEDDERASFEGEAHDVAALLGTDAIAGDRAVAEVLREQGPGADLIHLSCHGNFDSAEPLASYVELADGRLTAREVMGLDLKARLVTISACSTRERDVSPGDELMGLTRAFLYAGASAVVVTLWDVDPEAARKLVATFVGAGVASDWRTSPAELLREAMPVVRATHPATYYWAPFVVVGNAG